MDQQNFMPQEFGVILDKKKKDEALRRKRKSFTMPDNDDGSTIVTSGGAYYGTYLELDVIAKNESDLISKYRQTSMHPDVDTAIQEIVNDAIITQEEVDPVEIDTSKLEYSDKIKNSITDEFNHIMKLLDMKNRATDIFYRWYVDGRIYYEKIFDENTITGIQELRYIDPRKIKKVKNVVREKDTNGLDIVKKTDIFYLYNEQGINFSVNYNPKNISSGVKISPENIAFAPSGLMDMDSNIVISHLHKAIKPTNQLKMLADSLVIYRLSRAPERRIFYIDVGNLPQKKAEEYMKDLMNRYKNKIVYDSATGEIKDSRKFMTMLEDFWLPRKDGKGTEISTLPGGCLAMDTKVSLLDGRDLSIREIENELNLGKELWTYSCDEFTGEIKPGLISWAGVTQKQANVMKITLDNGESIVCTPDHKFPLYGRGFVEAKDLTIDESMIPLYRDYAPLSKGNNSTYERVFNNNNKKWEFTHRLVSKFINLSVETHEEDFGDGYVIHHKDCNRYNNTPINLCKMSFKDHRLYHQSISFPPMIGTIAAANRLRKEKESNSEWWKDYRNNKSIKMKDWWYSLSEEEKIKWNDNHTKGIKVYYEKLSDDDKQKRISISNENLIKAIEKSKHLQNNDPVWKESLYNNIRNAWTDEKRKIRGKLISELNKVRFSDIDYCKKYSIEHKDRQEVSFNESILKRIIDLVKNKTTHQLTIDDVTTQLNSDKKLLEEFRELNKNKTVPNWKLEDGFTSNLVRKCVTRLGGYNSWIDFRKKCSIHNHRIVNIEYLNDPIEVGTLTIDKDELIHNHHTFALSVGIFTKNSNLDQIADIEYFQNKVYQALNVPTSRFNQESQINFGRVAEINREELKFAKFVDRLRRKFSVLFDDLLRTQLIAKRIIAPEEWNDIKDKITYVFAQDQYYEESKEGELLRNRLDILNQVNAYIGTYFSKNYVRKKILRMTDEEIKEIDDDNRNDPTLGQEDDGMGQAETGPSAIQAAELSKQVD